MEARPSTLGYRPALDGLRAIAIALVVLHHTAAFLAPMWSARFLPGGFLGVDVFLVLSGFLITTLLLERRARERRPIGTFYLRRALRLLPAVVALLGAVAAFALLTGDGADRLPSTFLVVLTYSTNWAELAGVRISTYVTHLWSLAIEEQFYLVWPLLLYGALRFVPSRGRLVWLALGVALLAAGWRAVLWESGEGWLRIYLRTDARADALLIGAALALAPWDRLLAGVGSALLTVAGGLALVALVVAAQELPPSSGVLYLGGFTAVALLAAVALVAALPPGSPLATILAAAPLVLLGRLSYSLYLWHFPIFQYVGNHATGWPAAARIALGWALALSAAGASYRFVERPVLRIKGRLGAEPPENVQGAP